MIRRSGNFGDYGAGSRAGAASRRDRHACRGPARGEVQQREGGVRGRDEGREVGGLEDQAGNVREPAQRRVLHLLQPWCPARSWSPCQLWVEMWSGRQHLEAAQTEEEKTSIDPKWNLLVN